MFFSEEKNQKTFVMALATRSWPWPDGGKSALTSQAGDLNAENGKIPVQSLERGPEANHAAKRLVIPVQRNPCT